MIIHDITRLIVLLAVEKGVSLEKHCLTGQAAHSCGWPVLFERFLKEDVGSDSVLEDIWIAVSGKRTSEEKRSLPRASVFSKSLRMKGTHPSRRKGKDEMPEGKNRTGAGFLIFFSGFAFDQKRKGRVGRFLILYFLLLPLCLAACIGDAAVMNRLPSARGRFLPVRKEQAGKGEILGRNLWLPRLMEPLEGENPKEAHRLASDCIVRLDVSGEDGEYYGSGVIWDVEDGSVVLVTAGHLLTKGEIARIGFSDGDRSGEYHVAISDTADVGFVEVPWQTVAGSMGFGNHIPAIACLHQRIFDSLDADSRLSVIASTQDGVGDLLCQGNLKERAWYREEFGIDVMLLDCRSREGMSGAGVFDGYGSLTGIVVGGSEVDTAVVSMEKINEAYEELYNRRRDTQPYRG